MGRPLPHPWPSGKMKRSTWGLMFCLQTIEEQEGGGEKGRGPAGRGGGGAAAPGDGRSAAGHSGLANNPKTWPGGHVNFESLTA